MIREGELMVVTMAPDLTAGYHLQPLKARVEKVLRNDTNSTYIISKLH